MPANQDGNAKKTDDRLRGLHRASRSRGSQISDFIESSCDRVVGMIWTARTINGRSEAREEGLEWAEGLIVRGEVWWIDLQRPCKVKFARNGLQLCKQRRCERLNRVQVGPSYHLSIGCRVKRCHSQRVQGGRSIGNRKRRLKDRSVGARGGLASVEGRKFGW